VSGFGDLLALAANVESVARAMRDLRSTVIDLRERAYEHDHDHYDEQHDQQGT
jgi:hypothetical protein